MRSSSWTKSGPNISLIGNTTEEVMMTRHIFGSVWFGTMRYQTMHLN